MATKLDKIKEQIKTLQKRARELERVNDCRIGKMVREMAANEWKEFDAIAFRKQVNGILTLTEKKTAPEKPAAEVK